MNALSVIQKDELMRRIFHVLLSTAPLKVLQKDDVSVLKSLGFKKAIDEMIKEGAGADIGGGGTKDKKSKKTAVSKGTCKK